MRAASRRPISVLPAADLPINSWYLEYADTNADLQVDTIFFHYKVNGYVPEPDTFGLALAGVFALRLLRRIRSSDEPAAGNFDRRTRRRRAPPGPSGAW